MNAYEELVERCAKAAYAKTAEHAPKYYTLPADLVRYAPWEEVSEAWRADYRSTIAAALVEVLRTLETVTPEMTTAGYSAKVRGVWADSDTWLAMLHASPLEPPK